ATVVRRRPGVRFTVLACGARPGGGSGSGLVVDSGPPCGGDLGASAARLALAKPALENVLIAGLATASLPAIVLFRPGAVPEPDGRMAAPHLFAAGACDSDATASRAGISLEEPEATIRALPSGAGTTGWRQRCVSLFQEGSGVVRSGS